MAAAAIHCHIPPKDFWRLTPREWAALQEAVRGPAPMGRAEFEALIASREG